MKRTLLLYFSFWLLWTYNLTAQEQRIRLEQIDVQHYRFALQLSSESDIIEGQAMIRLVCLQDLDQIDLDLQALEGETGMVVKMVMLNDVVSPFQHQEQRLSISPVSACKAGTEVTLLIEYSGIPQDGLIIGENKFGNRTFFGDNWPDRARHWIPSVDHPSDKATVEWIVTAPNDCQVIANGSLIERTDVSKNMRLTHYKTGVPLPTKVMVIGVAPFAVQHAGDADGIPVSSWVFPENREEGFFDYQPAVEILDWFIDKVGPYPYQKLANVQSKTRYGGMENAGNIFYYENSVTGKQEQNALIAHEIAHQWFGNSASEKSWHHVWLSEGFATYFTHLYLEDNFGRAVLDERLGEDRLRVLRFGRQRSVPVIDTTVTVFTQLLNPNSYQKGGWVLHMLRRQIGDDIFWRGIRNYYEQYKLSNALTSDFRQVMEEVSGQDLRVFFNQWLRKPGYPDLQVQWESVPNKNAVKVTIQQVQDTLFSFPIDIQVANAQMESIGEVTLEVSTTRSSMVIPIQKEHQPETLILDPGTNLLFTANITRKE